MNKQHPQGSKCLNDRDKNELAAEFSDCKRLYKKRIEQPASGKRFRKFPEVNNNRYKVEAPDVTDSCYTDITIYALRPRAFLGLI